MNPVFADLPNTVFDVMSVLARELGAINLGQGFPDDPGPADVREKAADALRDGYNQYPPMMGLPVLRRAIAAHYERHQALALDPDTEVMVTSGATEALAASLLALVSPGDEVVLFEPMYDAYLPIIRQAGGIPRFVTLRPPHFRLDEEALAEAFSERTRVVVLNNPLNPTATMFGEQDLALLARFCERFDVTAICDEVWEHVTFDGRPHRPLIGFEGMRDRTVKIGSAGKIFSLTGWKVGFVMAAPALLKVVSKAHQFLTFTTPPNLQEAVAYGLSKDEAYFLEMRAPVRPLARPAERRTRRPRLLRVAVAGDLLPYRRYRRVGGRASAARTTSPSASISCGNTGWRRFPSAPSMRRGPCATSSGCVSPSRMRPSTRPWSVSRV